MKSINMVTAILAAMLMPSLLAEDVYLLAANDASETGAITNAAAWKCNGTPSGAAEASLPSGITFGIGSKYTLSTLRSAAGDTVFTGKALCVGTSGGSTGYVAQYAEGSSRTSWDNWGKGEGLKLYRGYYRTGIANATSHIYGNIELINYGAAVFEFDIYNIGSFLHFHSPFTSEKNKKLRIVARADGGGVIFGGSMENFLGDIETYATSAYDNNAGTNPRMISFGTTHLAGLLSLGANSTLTTASATDVFTLGKLECDSIAGIDVKMALPETGPIEAGRIVITNSVSVVNGPVVVGTSYDPVTNLTANAALKPLVFKAGVAFSTSDFVWTPANESQMAALSASFVAEEDGSISLAVDSGALVKQTKMETGEQYVAIPGGSLYRNSSLTNAANWSDGCIPHGGAHYLVQSKSLRTPGDAMTYSATTLPPIDYTFPGRSLAIGNGASFLACCSNVTVGLLRLFDGSSFAQAQYTSATLNGKISVEGATLWKTYRAGVGDILTVKSELVGDGEICLISANANSAAAGQMFLDNANTNFTGRIRVSFNDGTATDFTTCMTLKINDGRALGGAGAAFDPKALTLERHGLMHALESTAISEATRGIWINGVGRIKVESGKALTLASPLAVYGTFCKEGAGVLLLANGQPKFGGSALDETPDAAAANRTFLVREGNVKVESAYALNGLDVVVEDPDATILLDADTADDTLAEYGIINTLAPETPFAVSGDAVKVKVAFVCAAKPSWTSREIAICTVKAAEAEATAALLENAAVVSGDGLKLKIESVRPVPVTIDDVSCVTLKATVSAQRGFCLIYR